MEEIEDKKTMTVHNATWLKLTYMKLNRSMKSLDELLNYLMDNLKEKK